MIKKRIIPIKCRREPIFILRIFLLIGTFSFMFLYSVQALEVPPLRDYVNDYAGLISPSVRTRLENDLKSFEKSDSIQLVILTVPSLKGEVLENFSLRVGSTWKIGQKGEDNGIVMVVAKQERKIRIEVGRGLEGVLTDLLAKRIVMWVIIPQFKNGDFDSGFLAGVSALIDSTKGTNFKLPVNNDDSFSEILDHDILEH